MEIALEKVCFIISRAREAMADLKELGEVGDEPGEHSADDVMLTDPPEEDPHAPEESDEIAVLKEFISGLNIDEQLELVALTWIGRGTFTTEDWDEALETARDEHSKRTADYLLSQPLLAEHLEEGLNEFDLSCEDVE